MAGSPASKPPSAAAAAAAAAPSTLSKTSSLPTSAAGSKPASASNQKAGGPTTPSTSAADTTPSKQGASPLSRPASIVQQPPPATAAARGAAGAPASPKPATTAAAAGAGGGGARPQAPSALQVPTAPAAPGLGTPSRPSKTPRAAKAADGVDGEQQQLQGEDKSYGTTAYWQEQAPGVDDLAQITSDWYGNWDELKLLLSRHMQCSDNVLLLGPGACTLHEQLYDCGWRALTVVDSCKAALEAWKTRSTLMVERHSLQFHVADPVVGLHYERFPYQAIIDKGVLDCILCRPDGVAAATAAVAHLRGALASPGTLLVFSHGPPSRRLPLLRAARWTNITVKQIVEPPITQQGPAAATLPAAVLKDCPLSGPGGQYWAGEPAPGSAEAAAAAGYVYICKHSLA